MAEEAPAAAAPAAAPAKTTKKKAAAKPKAVGSSVKDLIVKTWLLPKTAMGFQCIR